MVAMDVFAHAFGLDSKSDDVWTTLGKVTSVSGNTLSVLLGGSATPTECEAYCVAGVGDIVFVAISKGQARAIAAKGGMTDATAWRSILGLGSMATESASDYVSTSVGIGTLKYTDVSNNVSVASSTNKSIASISLDAGTWVVTYGASYSANSTGFRSTFLYTTADTSSSGDWTRATCIQTPGMSVGGVYHQGSHIIKTNSTSTYYLTCWQNSGSSLNCTGAIYAVKVG